MLRSRPAVCAAALALVFSCDSLGPPPGDSVPLGTWGGENAGMIVGDSGTHVHMGCTIGEIRGRITLDSWGRFDVPGSQNLTAYPVDRGVYLPARFTGVAGTDALNLTVTVNDTTTGRTVVLGPVRLVFGQTPHMGPCPICRRAPGAAPTR